MGENGMPGGGQPRDDPPRRATDDEGKPIAWPLAGSGPEAAEAEDGAAEAAAEELTEAELAQQRQEELLREQMRQASEEHRVFDLRRALLIAGVLLAMAAGALALSWVIRLYLAPVERALR